MTITEILELEKQLKAEQQNLCDSIVSALPQNTNNIRIVTLKEIRSQNNLSAEYYINQAQNIKTYFDSASSPSLLVNKLQSAVDTKSITINRTKYNLSDDTVNTLRQFIK